MSKYLRACMAGYLVGMKHKQLSKQLCWARMKKQAHRIMNMF